MRLFRLVIETKKVKRAPDQTNDVKTDFETKTDDIEGEPAIIFSLGDGGDGSSNNSRASGNISLAGYNVHISSTDQTVGNNYAVTGSLSSIPEKVTVSGGIAGVYSDVTLFAKGRYEG